MSTKGDDQMAGQSSRRAESAVVSIVAKIREMLAVMELLPGQPLRQEALATRLGVSRVPVREALRALEREGVLRHEPHVGYTVTRLTGDELRQTYLMRQVLETEILRALPAADEALLKRLTELNDDMARVAKSMDIVALRKSNHAFHFAIFRASGLHLVVAEVERIWQLTEAYRSVYLYDAASRERIVREHQQMIDALARGDNDALIELMNDHRVEVLDQLAVMLGPAVARTGGRGPACRAAHHPHQPHHPRPPGSPCARRGPRPLPRR